jgi:hypothetical protein
MTAEQSKYTITIDEVQSHGLPSTFFILAKYDTEGYSDVLDSGDYANTNLYYETVSIIRTAVANNSYCTGTTRSGRLEVQFECMMDNKPRRRIVYLNPNTTNDYLQINDSFTTRYYDLLKKYEAVLKENSELKAQNSKLLKENNELNAR